MYFTPIGNAEKPTYVAISQQPQCCAKKKKNKGFQLPAGAVQPLRTEGGNEQGKEQEYQEAIQALHKLFEGNTVAPRLVQQCKALWMPHALTGTDY